MSPEREARTTYHIKTISAAMLDALNFDQTKCARGLTIAATLLVKDDPVGKRALADQMLQQLIELLDAPTN
jgi:hypothetical protein